MTLLVPTPDLEERFGAHAVEPVEPRYNVSPTQDHPVIRDDDADTIRVSNWGFKPSFAEGGKRLINARAETVHEKRTFRESFERRRCLVLADGFYEWKRYRGGSQPYRVTLAEGGPFAMAGIWTPDDGASAGSTFTILTTDANPVVERIHDRMPVILEPGDESVWLDGDANESRLRAVLDPYPADEVTTYPVSSAVNDPSNDHPGLVDPIPGGDSVQSDFERYM